MTRTRVSIVPHTHWDREWYSPFQTFRLRLVDMLDEFLPLLERDLSYARFLLDGQMAVVDDYLEVRPEAEGRLRALAATGRVGMGPWYILMDEFLVSGETIVRNLQKGLGRAAAFGGAMPVGYLPDMFGHVAQMPQILRLAGIEHAVVWRGVPSAVDRSAFTWRAPDGSAVRAEYLMTGYGNGSSIPDDAKDLVARVAGYADEHAGFLLADGDGVRHLLFMNGTDHEAPQAWLGRVVAEVNDLQDDYELVVTSLPEYLAGAPTDGLPEWRGELRSGARANLLMGVASNRVDVKVAAARAERALERLAEPLAALFLAPDRYPAALLDLAWTEVIRNSAHDSICACSVDEVCDAVLHRYAEARQVADGLANRALRELGRSLPERGTWVLNPSARTRGGLVEVELPGTDPLDGAQVLATREAVVLDVTTTGAELAALLDSVHATARGADAYVAGFDVDEADDEVTVVVRATPLPRDNTPIEKERRALAERIGARADVTVQLRIEQQPSQRVLTRVDGLAGYGWAPYEPAAAAPVAVDGLRMANGLVEVEVDPGDGTWSVDGHAGLGRLVDGGDQGDTYNYSPPAADTVVDRPASVDVRVVERGPLRARIEVRAAYRWPAAVDETSGTRAGERDVEVVTELEVQAGEGFVRVRTRFDNTCRDHRLRVHFPLGRAVDRSRAECAFGVVERGLEAEGGPHEHGLPTFPSRRFVQAGPLTLAHEGLLEYEVVGEGRELALTLLRATGILSQLHMAYRPLSAGPPLRIEGPQCQGPFEARYAVAAGEVDPYALVDEAFVPLQVVRARGGGSRPATGRGLAVEGAEVSALRRNGGRLELRVFNPTAEATQVEIEGRSGWLVDLRGRPLEAFDGGFALGPWAIATAHLDD